MQIIFKQIGLTKTLSPNRFYPFDWLVWFVGFYGMSTFVGYLTPNPFFNANNQFFLNNLV